MTPLPVVSCEGCGSCCTTVGTPPGYALFFPPEGVPMYEWAAEDEDWPNFQALSAEALKELTDYYTARRRNDVCGAIKDRTRNPTPCLWFDEQTRRCRHYEHRPAVCREFEVGGTHCLRYRETAGLET